MTIILPCNEIESQRLWYGLFLIIIIVSIFCAFSFIFFFSCSMLSMHFGYFFRIIIYEQILNFIRSAINTRTSSFLFSLGTNKEMVLRNRNDSLDVMRVYLKVKTKLNWDVNGFSWDEQTNKRTKKNHFNENENNSSNANVKW